MQAWGHLKQHGLHFYNVNFTRLLCGKTPIFFFPLAVTKTISKRIQRGCAMEQNAKFLSKAQKNRETSYFRSPKKGGKFEKP